MIKFSDHVSLPANVTDWTHLNEGKDFIKIEYEPSGYSEQLFEDNQIQMDFKWSVTDVEMKETPLRLL